MATDTPRRRLTAVLVLAFTFLAGAATGAGLLASFGRPHGPHFRGPRDGRLPPPMEELGLSPEQHAKVDAIFATYRPRFEALFEETGPKVRALREEMAVQVRPLLTEEQRAKLEELERRRPHRGPPPPPL